MLEKIKKLERLARQLDPGAEQRRALFAQAGDYAESFLEALPGTHTYTRDEGLDGFVDQPFEETPTPMPELLDFFRREVDTTGILPASGGQMGYIPGGGLYPSAVGDFLADISNRYSGVSFAGPGAARMEGALIRWMCDLAGYPSTAAGDLTSGGSLATLSALVTARDARGIGPARIAESCIYMTAQAHHCIDKALHVAGLGKLLKRAVPMDERYRLDCGALESLIEADLEQGLNPWLIVGSAGTTDTGAIDPLRQIAGLAARFGLWFHLDAAYGGFFLLCEEGREALGDLSQADSIVMDPHKGLGIPYGSGAVLIRDGKLLARSNSYFADYMQDAKQPGQAPQVDHRDHLAAQVLQAVFFLIHVFEGELGRRHRFRQRRQVVAELRLHFPRGMRVHQQGEECGNDGELQELTVQIIVQVHNAGPRRCRCMLCCRVSIYRSG